MLTGGMAEMAEAVLTSGSAFIASNVDDIILLLLFFSSATTSKERWQIVLGQYVGFTVLVLASFGGFFGGHFFPSEWIGLLGLLPISLGVTRWIESLETTPDSDGAPISGPWSANHAPALDALAIAAVTIGNGGDNLGLYLPLFAHATASQLLISVVVFAVMVGLWCLAAMRLVQAPALTRLLQEYVQPLVPFVLIALGGLILIDSHVLQSRGLATITLIALAVMVSSLLRQLHQLQSQATLSCRSR